MDNRSSLQQEMPQKPALKAAILLRPTPLPLLMTLSIVVLLAGAAYCTGYEALVSGRIDWAGSLLWSTYGALPWLLLFEFIKRREWEADRPLRAVTIMLLIGIVGAASILADIINHEWLVGRKSAPLALQLLRRVPAVGALLLLLMLSRREQQLAQRRATPSREAATEEAENLRRHSASIRWIQAADNYLELHLDGQVWTRRITMRQAAEILKPFGFVRVHRSVIVNRDHVARIIPQSGGAAVRMTDGTSLPTGRAFSSNLHQLR